ncbi:MAG: GH36 C-terminal domain-containing protein [Clostridia bacterium]|nr:GH36 C-terminal domain-containing protein [Clostridia bacterium]
MKNLIKLLLLSVCTFSALSMYACNDNTLPEKTEIPLDGEVSISSGNSEIRLQPVENGLNITYLATKESKNNYIGEASSYALPQCYYEAGKIDRHEFVWNFTDRTDITDVINGVAVSGYKFRFDDPACSATLYVSCISRESLDGPFEFVMELTNGSADSITILPHEFSSLSLAQLNGDTSVFAVKKESGMAEGYVHKDGTTFEGTGIYERKLSKYYFDFPVWVNTYQDFNSSGFLPMVYVNNGDKNGVYAALEWSNGRVIAKGKKDYYLTLSVDMDGVSYEKEDFSTKVPASDTFVFPSVYYGVYDGTVDDGSNVFKSWFFNCKSPEILRENENEPLTQMDYQLGLEAGRIGVEAIKWDYGWWSNETANKSTWKTYEGSWVLRNQDAINSLASYGCSTLAEFGKMVEQRGITWTVYLLLHDTVDVDMLPTDEFSEFNSKTHPEWFSDRRITTGHSADLGNVDCVEYLKTAIADFFNENNITTWRSDFEPISHTSDKENRHAARGSDVMYWCTVGFRDLVQYLYDNVEGFRYESCSSGGSMKDLFTATQAVVINCDDISNYLSMRMSFYDSSYVIHPSQLQLPFNKDTFDPAIEQSFYPVVEPDEVANAENWRDTMLDMGYRTLILGVPMFSSWTGDVPEDYISEYSEMYREKVRPLVRDGNLYHILPRPDGTNWDGIMYADPDSDNDIKGVVFLFKPSKDVSDQYNVVMKGLDPKKTYSLVFEDRPEQNTTVSGESLMSEGLNVEILGVGSEIIWIYEA